MKILTPLNTKPSQILHEIKDKEMLERPDKMRSAPSKKDKNLWCRYHNNHGHTTDNCESLKHAIEALIKRGHLRRYFDRREERREASPLAGQEGAQENAGVINTISGRIAEGGSSEQGRKAYAREVLTTMGPLAKRQKMEPAPAISFYDEDVGDTKTPHDDPLVVTLRVESFDMKRILVDNGSSAEVLFYEAFQKMSISFDRLCKIDTPLNRFINHPVVCEGIIALPVTVGTPPAQAKLMLDFVVVHVPSAYNMILGRTSLNQLRAVVSTYHMKMKFPTEHGVGEVKGDQRVARLCYMASCRNRAKETLMIGDLRDETKMERGKPTEDLMDIELYPRKQEKTARIGTGFSDDLKLKLVDLLRSYSDIFTWTASDMPGIDPKVITHKLNMDPLKKPVKQKKRTFAPERQSHTIVVLSDQPLGKVLQNPDASGRLVNWSVELGEFDIKYKPRVAIKAQALSDFVVECTVPEDPPQLVLSEVLNPWLLYVNGSSKVGSSGAGLIRISPEKFMIKYSLHFDFQASNNEAEYEALLAGIRLAHSLRVESLSVHSDSQLVVNHILDEYGAKDNRMALYLQAMKTEAAKLKNYSLSRLTSVDISKFFPSNIH
ncbi:hypothetical protein RJ639_036389 [Escallonia herrerae]|uniref:RNase H type-1 domain-containing protein n=1 Tax=Escallonia herrerae TaxID=1293975 RepID=A0AA88X441_9ASTE|nr:hypothetical protein RJ639_036389 [Escallonia herrerae]